MLIQDAIASFAPPPRLTVSEWADSYRQLSAEGSAEPGKWRTSRAIYQKEIMDTLGSEEFHTVVVMSSAQVGKSEILLNTIGYDVHLDPCPILLLQPTLEMAESFSKERLAPMIRDTKALEGKIKTARSRDSGNTLLHKNFPGGHLTLAGANSPSSLASRPIRKVRADEIDRYPASAGTEGDPVKLATKRTATFWNRQVLLVSTPGLLATSRINKAWLESDQRRYLMPCPHCGFEQPLEWERVSYPGKGTELAEADKVVYLCIGCDKEILERNKPEMLALGKWVATAESKGVAGFHLNELYSPWRSWVDVCLDFESARKDPQQYQVWVNTSLGLPYEGNEGDKLDWEVLWARSRESDYKQGEIPEGVLLLTAGVDVQIDRLEVCVWGWGVDEEAWVICHEVILGDPVKDGAWELLQSFLSRTYKHPLGGELKVIATCVDTGFLATDLYPQVRKRKSAGWYAIKGKAGDRVLVSRPSWQEVNYQGRVLKRGIQLYTIGVDKAKTALYARSKILEEGAKFMHVPNDIEQDWCEGFCSEVQVVKHRSGQPYMQWEKLPGIRNEPLDCSVYAFAAGNLAGMSRVNWERLKEKVTRDEEEEQPRKRKARSRPKNWVKNW